MDTNSLNEFSKKVYGWLSESYPLWIDQIENSPKYEGTLILRVPSPNDPKFSLIVDTIDDEITVAFGANHSHFGWSDVQDEVAFKCAKALINDIVSGRVLVVSKFSGAKWGGSATIKAEELEDFQECNPGYNTVVSWARKY